MMCGGVGDKQDATDETREFCEQLKKDVLKQCGKDEFEVYKALSFTSQVVAGTNYFVKIQITKEGDCVHARIFKPLPHTGENVELHSVQRNKKVDEDIQHF